MKSIEKYVLEKLKINKDIKTNNSILDNNIEKIYLMCDSEVIDGTEIGKITKQVIEDWVKENNVEKFTGYANKKELWDMGMYEDTIKLFIDCKDNMLTGTLKAVKANKVESIEETPKSSGRDFYYDDKFFVLVTKSNNKEIIKVFLKKY